MGPVALLVIRVVAVALLLSQAIGSTTARSTTSDDGSVFEFVCTPAGKTSDDRNRAKQDLLDRSNENAPDDSDHKHCLDCITANLAVFPEPIHASVSAELETATDQLNLYQPAFSHLPQGPPLGTRAPPLTA